MKKIQVYAPQCQVLLHKVVGRSAVSGAVPVSERFSATQRTTIDLTPFLSEQGGIHTSKSVADPAGAFSLTLVDKPLVKDGGLESLYGLVEPQDMVEIRIAREPHLYKGKKLPIVMRGFVSNVSRVEVMTQDGRPSRQVVITGLDFGKIWQIIQLKYWTDYAVGERFISGFPLFEKYGVGFETGMLAAEFLQQVIDKIINPFMADFMPSVSGMPQQMTTEISTPPASVSVSGAQHQDGTICNLLHTFLDVGAFNELYIEDREDSIVVVYRPNPFKDVALASTVEPGGTYIQNQAFLPVHVPVTSADMTQISLYRSDQNAANWFWVTSPSFEILHGGTLKLFALQGDLKKVSIADYPNSAVKLYGLRVMEEATQQGLDSVLTSGSQKEAKNKREADGYATWLNSRLDILREQNKDNVVFEQGTIVMKGNTDVQAGCYLQVKRGSLNFECYVTSVVQQYVPLGAFTTTVNVERCTSFIERIKRGTGKDSPYLIEMT